MKIRHRLGRGAQIGALLLCFSGGVLAAQLKENSADILQAINVPGMSIDINPGNPGCDVAKHEKWEPTENGCSNTEWAKKTARVVSVIATPPEIAANNVATSTLVATVKDTDGNLVGGGIPTTWSTTRGTLSSTSSVTNATGQSVVTLRGTVAGLASVTASAVAGSSSGNVSLLADASTSRVVSLTSNPSTVAADGTKASLFATVRDAYNNILPAGQAVYWSATLNTLSGGLSYTDAAGVATATIAGATTGVSTIFAKTTVSGNASTEVTFANSKPIINSFSEYSDNRYMGGASVLLVDGESLRYVGNNIFSWTASGADRYELIAPNGKVWYQGSGTSYVLNQWMYFNQSDWYPGGARIEGTFTWTLRSYNGGQYSEAKLNIRVLDGACYCQSG